MAIRKINVKVASASRIDKATIFMETGLRVLDPNTSFTEWTGSFFVDVEGPLDFVVVVEAQAETKWGFILTRATTGKEIIKGESTVPVDKRIDAVAGSVQVDPS